MSGDFLEQRQPRVQVRGGLHSGASTNWPPMNERVVRSTRHRIHTLLSSGMAPEHEHTWTRSKGCCTSTHSDGEGTKGRKDKTSIDMSVRQIISKLERGKGPRCCSQKPCRITDASRNIAVISSEAALKPPLVTCWQAAKLCFACLNQIATPRYACPRSDAKQQCACLPALSEEPDGSQLLQCVSLRRRIGIFTQGTKRKQLRIGVGAKTIYMISRRLLPSGCPAHAFHMVACTRFCSLNDLAWIFVDAIRISARPICEMQRTVLDQKNQRPVQIHC